MTWTAMGETFARIDIYAQSNRSLPTSLEMLPKREHYMNRTTDGWGRSLLYSVSQDGIISLTSLGKDGVLGGQGEDADITEAYYTRRTDGTLWAGSDLWLVEAEVKPSDLHQNGQANRIQPIRSETNSTSSTAGSDR
jgi:hypothetical protein